MEMFRSLMLVMVAAAWPVSPAPGSQVVVDPAQLQRDFATGLLSVKTKPAGDRAAEAAVPYLGKDAIGRKLRLWYANGSAAGNIGDLYDNRDRGHSRLPLNQFPQLTAVTYAPSAVERSMDFGLQTHLLFDRVTLGNSSTAAGGGAWRSNPRQIYMRPGGPAALYHQYRANHLYVYPEHKDHDPGHNDIGGGHGDVIPANTPYVITSQGSSGSDRAFLRAIACTLAAFDPQTKQALARHGLLMPTVQMILRRCYRGIESDEDYRTGRAHPTVFEEGGINVEAMIEMAHDMTRDALPPFVQIAVIAESEPLLGRDYFEIDEAQKLFDTPAAIARVFRTTEHVYRMVVAAAGTDVHGRELSYHWAVLRGDAERITITPRNAPGTHVEIKVAYHGRRPIQAGHPMASNRVDIGVFVTNGVHSSAPAIVSINTLDCERRTYSTDGRILEVDYEAGVVHVEIKDWPGVMEMIHGERDDEGAMVLRQGFDAAQQAEMRRAAIEYEQATAAETQAREVKKRADDHFDQLRAASSRPADGSPKRRQPKRPNPAKSVSKEQRAAIKRAGQVRQAATKRLEQSRQQVQQVLNRDREALGGSVRRRVEGALYGIVRDPGFYIDRAESMDRLYGPGKQRASATGAIKQRTLLVKLNLLAPAGPGSPRRYLLVPARPGEGPPAERLTAFEHRTLQQLHAALLNDVLFAGLVKVRFRRNYVDPMLATRKAWRDLYHNTGDQGPGGWTRYHEDGRVQRFTAAGERVVEVDDAGNILRTTRVKYIAESKPKQATRWLRQLDVP